MAVSVHAGTDDGAFHGVEGGEECGGAVPLVVAGDRAAATVAALRAEGKKVLLHCVQAQSRTPAVAALYGARLTDRTPTEALADITTVLPHAHPNAALQAALERLG